jgi:hypothetical protein
MELDLLIQESYDQATEAFYEKEFQFSYSSLSKLMWNPPVFYSMYVLGQKEEKTDAHLMQGKMIHALLLEPEKFEDDFIVSPTNLPSGQLKQIIDRIYAHHLELKNSGDQREFLDQFGNAILDVMVDMNYYQTLVDDKKTGVTGDQKRLDKVITPETLSYWSFLKIKEGKTLVDFESMEFCKGAVEIIKQNQEVCDLIGLGTTDFDYKDIHNEKLLVVRKLPSYPFGIKGIVDNLVIDHEQKVIYINDIKTTAKELINFPESIEYWNYWMQAAMYQTLVGIHHADLLDQGYTIEFRFIAIDRNFMTYPFPVSNDTMTSWVTRLHNELEKARWHYEQKQYGLPYDLQNKLVVL